MNNKWCWWHCVDYRLQVFYQGHWWSVLNVYNWTAFTKAKGELISVQIFFINCMIVGLPVKFVGLNVPFKIKSRTRCGASRLWSQHMGGWGKWVSLSSRPAWFTKRTPGQNRLYKEIKSWKKYIYIKLN